MIASDGSTMVEHLCHHPMVVGVSPATICNKNGKKWQNIFTIIRFGLYARGGVGSD